MATNVSCGGSAVDNNDHSQPLDQKTSKNSSEEPPSYPTFGDFTLETLPPCQTLRYLDFLRVRAPPRASIEVLDTLITAHLERVPFQGIDTYLGRFEPLDVPTMFSRVVEQDRGGNCFELNSLFARLLLSLGYKVNVRFARRRWALPRHAPLAPVDHVVLCVDIEDGKDVGSAKEFLVDVGFGGPCPQRAIPLDGDASPYRVRRLEKEWSNSLEISLRCRGQDTEDDSGWLPLYQVFPYSQEWADIADKSFYLATYPGISFRELLAVSRYDGDFWVTLRNTNFTRRRCTSEGLANVVEHRRTTDIAEFLSLLRDELQLKYDPDMEKQLLDRFQHML
ncbi:hypothetical protein V5799_015410 [Amblyomma americanum]|uniref:arylamine N-acetyltransferase n=1 Tax=Amblyomma americanum TaxID=6943 RepID=A0AAQ4F857_AMBAM